MTRRRPVRTFATFVVSTLIAAGVAGPALARADRPQTGDPTVLDVLVLDPGGKPVAGLTGADFVVTGRSGAYRVDTAEGRTAGEAPRRFVFVFNRRGADAAQLNRALRGLRSFIAESLGDSDETLFADLGETLRIGRAFGPGKPGALEGLRTIPAMGYRSPAGATEDAAAAAELLVLVAERLAATPGRKIVVLFSESVSSFSYEAEQPGTFRTSNVPMIRSGARGQTDAGLASIMHRLAEAQATVHVIHLEGVQEYEERILTSERDESNPFRAFSSTSYEGRFRTVSPRSGDDILSGLAAATGGLYFARPTGFQRPLDRIEHRNRSWYRVTLVGEVGAGERESQVLQVRVPGCSGCTVLPAPSAAPE